MHPAEEVIHAEIGEKDAGKGEETVDVEDGRTSEEAQASRATNANKPTIRLRIAGTRGRPIAL